MDLDAIIYFMTDRLARGPDKDVHVPSAGSGVLHDGSDAVDAELIATPDDIVTLRSTDPAAVARWRRDTRTALTAALDAGRPIVGFTRNGEYVVGQA